MKKNIFIVLILVFLVLVFWKFFLPGPVVWGDAPYFFPEGLKELVAFPTAWISRGNSLGGINLFIWIYPLMVIYGVLGTVMHLSNDLIVRILFYFPSLIFATFGTVFLTRYMKFSKVVQFFSTLIFLINTYYLLLVDGGQVGVVLAYGLFPLTLLFLIKLVDSTSTKNFVIALFSGFILTIVDFRIAAICVLTAFVWRLNNFKKVKILVLLVISLIGLSFYWIYPTLRLATNVLSGSVSSLQLTSILNSLFLISPNWPMNEFGKVAAPPFYFFLVPILIFLPLFMSKEKRIVGLTASFLFFAFLVKGETPPFGFIYSFLVNTKIGVILRDSTKFFVPLLLMGGILIGTTIEEIGKKLTGKKLVLLSYILSILFILFLVWQAIFGRLNGVLGRKVDVGDFEKIKNEIVEQDGFLRAAWFTEKSPFAFHTEDRQALDAKDLVNFRPFATLNVGSGDRFNFINKKQYLEWFSLLGIKYLVFSGNPRTSQPKEVEQQDWDRLLNLIAKDNRLKKLDVKTSFAVYENSDIKPHEFFVDKVLVIVGADDIYEEMAKLDNDFSVSDQGFLFTEDGKLDPLSLENIASTSAVIVFNGKSEKDLTMSFLQKEFISPIEATSSQWAQRQSQDYLDWKYELLVKGIDTHEFDYGKGIAFSTEVGEKMEFNMQVPEDGDYYLDIRSMTHGGDLKVDFNNTSDVVRRKKMDNFEWYEKGPLTLKKGDSTLVLQNTKGLQVVNTVSLVSSDDMRIANQKTKNFLDFFKVINLGDKKDNLELEDILINSHWRRFDKDNIKEVGWIVYSDQYNKNWILDKGDNQPAAYPFYSMINGFYVDAHWSDLRIVFKGNDEIKWGIYFSVVSFLSIVIILFYVSHKDERKSNKDN